MIQFILMGKPEEVWAELNFLAQLELATGRWLVKYQPGDFSRN